MLGKFHARWDKLERKEREDLLQRLNVRRAGLIAQSTSVPAPVAPAVADRRPHSHRGGTVDSVNFHGSSHSLRLLEQLRGVRNLSVGERRDVLQRWPMLTPDERRDLVTPMSRTTPTMPIRPKKSQWRANCGTEGCRLTVRRSEIR